MTYNPYDPMHRGRDDRYLDDFSRDASPLWGLGALAGLVLLGVLLWAFSGGGTNTATNPGDTNTGVVTRPAPAPPSSSTP